MAKRRKSTSQSRTGTTSVAEVRAARALDTVTPAFVDWCVSGPGIPAGVALEILAQTTKFVVAYFEQSPAFEVTNFMPGPFEQALGGLIAPVFLEDEDEATSIFDAVHLYLEFLEDTEAWTGTWEDLETIHAQFHLEDGGLPGEMALPELSPEEELAGLEGTELAHRLDRLLRWIGAGQDVTSTGALKLKDVAAAGAAVGVAVTGIKPAANKDQDALFAAVGVEESGGRPAVVKSMYQEPMLAKFWAALEAVQLIDVGATRVRLTSRAHELLEPGYPNRRQILREFTTNFLVVSVLGEQEWAPWIAEAAMAQTALLVMASNGQPVRVESLADAVAPGVDGLDSFVPNTIQKRMAALAELGLVMLGEEVQVPPFMVASIMELLKHADRFDEEDDDVPWGAQVPVRQESSAQRKRRTGAEAQTLQVKIMIEGSKPPIWRRLLLRSDVPLTQLHRIIQDAFGWFDCHLHEFRVGGHRGTVYGPPSNDYGFGEPPLDEAKFTLGDLVSKEKDRIHYVYDFGDDWDHSILVEKVLEYDAGDPAVRCTGGRGAAPAEDSGGVWGWQGILAILEDPSHAEYAEYRDWLGLADGEVFDPKAFDQDALNEHFGNIY